MLPPRCAQDRANRQYIRVSAHFYNTDAELQEGLGDSLKVQNPLAERNMGSLQPAIGTKGTKPGYFSLRPLQGQINLQEAA